MAEFPGDLLPCRAWKGSIFTSSILFWVMSCCEAVEQWGWCLVVEQVRCSFCFQWEIQTALVGTVAVLVLKLLAWAPYGERGFHLWDRWAYCSFELVLLPCTVGDELQASKEGNSFMFVLSDSLILLTVVRLGHWQLCKLIVSFLRAWVLLASWAKCREPATSSARVSPGCTDHDVLWLCPRPRWSQGDPRRAAAEWEIAPPSACPAPRQAALVPCTTASSSSPPCPPTKHSF